MLHFLPLQQQQSFVCALTGDAAKAAARLATKRRYFINSPVEFRYQSRPRKMRAEPAFRRMQFAAAELGDAVNA
jgi:hypothetical protein